MKFSTIRDAVTDLGMTLMPPTWAQARLVWWGEVCVSKSFSSAKIRYNNLQNLCGGDGCAGALGSRLGNFLDLGASDDEWPADGVVSKTLDTN